jgi:hypothetical protein
MDIEKVFKPIEPKRIPIPPTEQSQYRSIKRLMSEISNKINTIKTRDYHE